MNLFSKLVLVNIGVIVDSNLIRMFRDQSILTKIQIKLPFLFQLAETENMRAGKIGMEIGVVRERIITSLLIHYFGEECVDTAIPTTEPEIDVKLLQNPISIKTITGRSLRGVKLSWTVDANSARVFANSYVPSCDMLLAQLNWNGIGGLYYFPMETQKSVFDRIGAEAYLVLPKLGTNPRGVEASPLALRLLSEHPDMKLIPIQWNRQEITFNQFTRWVDLWAQE